MRHIKVMFLTGTIISTAMLLPEPQAGNTASASGFFPFNPSPFEKIALIESESQDFNQAPTSAIGPFEETLTADLYIEEMAKAENSITTTESINIEPAEDLPVENNNGNNGDLTEAPEGDLTDIPTSIPNNEAFPNTSLIYGPPLPTFFQKTIIIKEGQTLASSLKSAGANNQDSFKVINALRGQIDARKIRPGQKLRLTLDADKKDAEIIELGIEKDFNQIVIGRRTDGGSYQTTVQSLPTLNTMQTRMGSIDDNLFLSARAADVPTEVLIDMIRLFSYDVDFQRQIRKGDGFRILFERKTRLDNGQHQDGRILFAELTLQGKPMGYYYYKPLTETSARYFDENGKSAQKALMKTPVDGARISGTFGKRRHPILGYTKNHYGVDFAANRGTPIMAAGDGVVERASRWGSFGNYIRIRHRNGYKTAYAHLNGYARGIRQGKRVQQGQIIGYVGTTGRSTGPHLHYEVYSNGKRVNPLRLKFPTGYQLPKNELGNLQAIVKDRQAKFQGPMMASAAKEE